MHARVATFNLGESVDETINQVRGDVESEALAPFDFALHEIRQGQNRIFRRSDVESPASLLKCMPLRSFLPHLAIRPIRGKRDIDLL